MYKYVNTLSPVYLLLILQHILNIVFMKEIFIKVGKGCLDILLEMERNIYLSLVTYCVQLKKNVKY